MLLGGTSPKIVILAAVLSSLTLVQVAGVVVGVVYFLSVQSHTNSSPSSSLKDLYNISCLNEKGTFVSGIVY
jgi:hypothetical protein